MRKPKIILSLLIAAIFTVGFISCDDDDDNSSESQSLYVKFLNEESSTYTITTLQTRNRGKVGSQLEPTSDWSANWLNNGKTLVPGESFYFTINIPSEEWAEYRLGVDNGNGVEVMLYDQPNYDGYTDLPITHWGSDERSVSVFVVYDQYSQTITVNGWSDWAGIDD